MRLDQISFSDDELKILLESGLLLREASRFRDAASVFEGCIALLPDSEVPLAGLSSVMLQSGKSNLAVKYAESAIRIKPESPYARLAFGEALLFDDQRNAAKIELEKLIKNAPGTNFAETAKQIMTVTGLNR